MKAKSLLKLKKSIVIAIASVMLFMTVASSIGSNAVSSANAGIGLCSNMGYQLGLELTGAPRSGTGNNKKWNVEELFSNQISWSMYYGEGEGDFFYADKEDFGAGKSTMYNEKVKEIVEQPGLRSFGRCVAPSLKTAFPTLFFAITQLVSMLVSSVVVALFTNNIISDSLIKVIGGSGASNGGMIGALTSGIYMPLVFFAIIALAIWVIHNGLIKRKFRESLSGLAWALMAFFIGVALMYNPSMVAKAPQAVTNTISECVVGSLSGHNCLTGQANNQVTSLVGVECLTYDDSTKNIDGLVRGMSCSIWKTFVLDTWAQGQFGLPYNELYVKSTNMPTDGKLWSGASSLSDTDKEKFGVPLKSTGSESDYKNKVIETSSDKVYNLALYHLYLRTAVEDVSGGRNEVPGMYEISDGKLKVVGHEDPRFYNLISALSNDQEMFNVWASKGTYSSKTGLALVSMFGMVLAGALLITLAIFGMTYEVVSTITVLFAPVFFLFALHPGRGRKIFLGWVETLMSAFMKYFATILLAIIALMLYSAVLQNTSGMMAFISIVVLSSALFVYRKEVTNLLGAVNMGGARMSNALGKKLSEQGKKLKSAASATVGSAVGSRLAGGTLAEGASQGLKREIKRGRSFTAQAVQQYDRTKTRFNNDEKKNMLNSAAKGANDNVADNKGTTDQFNGNGDLRTPEWAAKEESTSKSIDNLLKKDIENGSGSTEFEDYIEGLSNGKVTGEDREITLDVLVQKTGEDGVTMGSKLVKETLENEEASLNSINLATELIVRKSVMNGELTSDDAGKITSLQERAAIKQVPDESKRGEFVKSEVDKIIKDTNDRIAKRNNVDGENNINDENNINGEPTVKPMGPSDKDSGSGDGSSSGGDDGGRSSTDGALTGPRIPKSPNSEEMSRDDSEVEPKGPANRELNKTDRDNEAIRMNDLADKLEEGQRNADESEGSLNNIDDILNDLTND